MEKMKVAKQRSKQFSAEEVKRLLSSLEDYPAILTKKTDVSTNAAKEQAWQNLRIKFNAVGRTPRDVQQLKLKWDNLKKAAKKRAAHINANNRATGGCPSTIITEDEILDKVIDMTKINCFGLPNKFDNDADEGVSQEASPIVIEFVETYPENSITEQESTRNPEVEKEETANGSECPPVLALHSKWKQWTPASLKTPKSTKLMPKKGKLQMDLINSKIARNNAIADYYKYKFDLLQKKNLKE